MTQPTDGIQDGDTGQGSSLQDAMQRFGPLFLSGIVVGLILAVGGVIALNQKLIDHTPALLILCSGLGIVFGAFGSTATIKYKGIVITGVAAIGAALLLLVDYLAEDDYVMLTIRGDVDKTTVSVYGDSNAPYLGAPRHLHGRIAYHQFVIIAKKIQKPSLHVLIDEGKNEPDSEHVFGCVPKKWVEPHLGSGKWLEWDYDKNQGRLIEVESQEVIAEETPHCGRAELEPSVNDNHDSLLAAVGSAFVSVAQAADSVTIKQLLKDLEASNSYVRRQARKSLADKGLDAIRPMLDQLAAEPTSYRTELGVVVALNAMLRVNKDKREEVSELITVDDLKRLVQAAGHKDRTLRNYATEFLYDLGDPSAVPFLLEQAETADDAIKGSLLTTVEGTYPYMDDAARSQTEQKLSSIRQNADSETAELIDRTIDGLTSSAGQKYWVIVGSYTDKSEAQTHADDINSEEASLNAFVGLRQPKNRYYPVIVGDYVEREDAEALVAQALKLNAVRNSGSSPYLSAYSKRRP